MYLAQPSNTNKIHIAQLYIAQNSSISIMQLKLVYTLLFMCQVICLAFVIGVRRIVFLQSVPHTLLILVFMITTIRKCHNTVIQHVSVAGSAKHYIKLGKRYDLYFLHQTFIEAYSNDLYCNKQKLDD